MLSVPGKLLERVVRKSIDDHIISNGILNNRQWGFRKGHSIESLLPHLMSLRGELWIQVTRLESYSSISAKLLIAWTT